MRRANIVAACIGLCGLIVSLPAARAEDQKPIKALLVCGGCCHDYLHQKDILTKGVSARANVEWTIAYDPDTTTHHKNPVYDNPDWYKGFDVIVHDECSSDVKDMETIDRILEPHRHGLPGVNLHCAMHCYRSDPYPMTTPWMEFTGMNTNHHNAQIPIAITFSDSSSPITKGMDNWTTIREELYHAEQLLPTAHALASGRQNTRREPESVVIWTNDYHGTRVFSTTLGHNNDTVADGRYLDLITRGLLWSVNKLDSEYHKPAAHARASAATARVAAAPVDTASAQASGCGCE